MNPAKRTQKVSQRLPQAFNRVDVNFTDAIAIIISRPLFLTMTDHSMTTLQPVIALPLIAVTGRAIGGELFNVPMQRLFGGAFFYSQATLAAASSDCPDHWRAVILVCAMTPSLIGSTPRRIRFVAVLFSFFPQRSETSRLFQSGGLSRASLRASHSRSLAVACASYERSGERCQVLRLRPENFHLCTRRARAGTT
jgi:hypothetical protein